MHSKLPSLLLILLSRPGSRISSCFPDAGFPEDSLPSWWSLIGGRRTAVRSHASSSVSAYSLMEAQYLAFPVTSIRYPSQRLDSSMAVSSVIRRSSPPLLSPPFVSPSSPFSSPLCPPASGLSSLKSTQHNARSFGCASVSKRRRSSTVRMRTIMVKRQVRDEVCKKCRHT